MGLDQYLFAERYIPRWTHSSEDERTRADAVLAAADLSHLQTEDAGVTVRSTAAYWRKANQVHRWFVSTVQNDVDDCGTYYVDLAQLTELRDAASFVLASSELVADMVTNGQTLSAETGWQWKSNLELGQVILDPKVAQNVLPAQSGFFFGSTEYDQWYVNDLVRTVEQLSPIIARAESESLGVDFYYHSSW